MSLTAGSRLGAYEISGALGAGGMGEVYRARDTKLGRDVAIKILPELFVADPDRVARFEREAQLLAALNHPHIAAIYGLEESARTKFLILELVEGESLAARLEGIRGKGLGISDALAIARQIVDALEAAHEKGIVHRDLKPANIMVTADGHVKVLDFGLAKLEPVGADAGAPVGLTHSPTLTFAATQAGMILGTAAYMSPEQARGRAADKRADVWAFGCVLFEMLTGKRAFDGDDATDVIAAVVRAEPDWNALPAALPPRIRMMLRRCLEKDRKRRIGDVAAVLYVLTEAAEPSDNTAIQPRTLVKGPVGWALAGALTAVVIASSLALVWMRAPQAGPITRFTIPLPDGEVFTSAGRQFVAISPDGRQIAYIANAQLYVRRLSDADAKSIRTGESDGGFTNIAFSPDGQSIVFFSVGDRTLKRVPVSGGTPVTLCPANNPFGLSWDADGILFAEPGVGILRVAAGGGPPDAIVRLPAGEFSQGPQLLPDGRTVLFTVAKSAVDSRWDDAEIAVQQMGSNERHTLIRGGSDARYLPTGHIVYAIGGTVFAVPMDVRRMRVTGAPFPVVEGVRRAVGSGFGAGSAQFATATSGTLIYVPGPVSTFLSQRELVMFDRHGGVQPLKLPRNSYASPRISPDGKLLAFQTEEKVETILWVYDLAGESVPRRLTFGGRNRFPIWSPDSRSIAFQSDRQSDLGIFRQQVLGTAGAAERVTRAEPGTSHIPESWSPDGDTLSFTIIGNSTNTLALFSLREKTTTPFVNLRSSGPFNSEISPDGHWIAYSARTSGTASVEVQPIPPTGARFQVSKRDTGHHPLWSADGKELFYFPAAGPLTSVRITTQPTFTVSDSVVVNPAFIANTTQTAPRNHDVARDGQRFIAAIDKQTQTGASFQQISVVMNWFEELKAHVPTR